MQSSALAFRPTNWSEVIGHEKTVSSLQKLLAERTPVCIGFSGTAGSGKTSLALIVAQAIQPNVPSDQLDIRHINCADKNGVDDARALAEDSKFRPLSGQYLVYILDEAHMLTVQAQNALLIPTEKKDSTTVWIICTTDPQKLIPALKSRCVWYDLKPFGPEQIQKLLISLSEKSGQEFPEKLYQEIVAKDLTSPRDICYSFDRLNSGLSAKDAVSSTNEREIQYTEIAQALLQGWGVLAPRLQFLKASDAKGLRITLSWFLRSTLIKSTGSKATALAELLIRLASQDAYEDSVSLAATTAALYICATKLNL